MTGRLFREEIFQNFNFLNPVTSYEAMIADQENEDPRDTEQPPNTEGGEFSGGADRGKRKKVKKSTRKSRQGTSYLRTV